MSFELRLKKVREEWRHIQALRDDQKKQRALYMKSGSEVKRLSQLISQKLIDYDELMKGIVK